MPYAELPILAPRPAMIGPTGLQMRLEQGGTAMLK